MITKIKLKNVGSYKNESVLITDKKVNLIYGLNGAGKTIFSNFLYSRDEQAYAESQIESLDDTVRLLVYNQRFVNDYFYQTDTLKGIFTLSKENKEIEIKIKEIQKELENKKNEKDGKVEEKSTKEQELTSITREVENKLWEIKTSYSGGDRILEFCLKGLMGSKSSLKEYLVNIPKPDIKPDYTTDDLKHQANQVAGEDAKPYDYLSEVRFDGRNIEISPLFQEVIIGNENSPIANLIKKLNHSDWVRQGLSYLPDNIGDKKVKCPFCQQETITKSLADQIKNYFDETYNRKVKKLKELFESYKRLKDSIPHKSDFISHPIIQTDEALKQKLDTLYDDLIRVIEKNLHLIQNKITYTSQHVELENTQLPLRKLNEVIKEQNNKIKVHNDRLKNKEDSLSEIKENFWNLMRWEYDQTIISYLNNKKRIQKELKQIEASINGIHEEIKKKEAEIAKLQKKTVNIEAAISSINNSLNELGITDLTIVKYTDNLYRIVRPSQEENAFHTLSEGEKTVISFLYFLQLCRGKLDPSDTRTRKVVVIDDPVSSLSHIYVFNVAQLIKREFFNGTEYDQVFVLTHSLYFFYELTDTNHQRRKENQKLFRIQKNREGSFIKEMKYEEIQNDYQSYWMIVNDPDQHPALIANCMRNIIEYFFNFVEKTDLNNVFQKPSLRADQYQAFCRYMNRESHSLGQNIFDLKEFDYSLFKKGLELVFKETGYDKHYEKMSKI